MVEARKGHAMQPPEDVPPGGADRAEAAGQEPTGPARGEPGAKATTRKPGEAGAEAAPPRERSPGIRASDRDRDAVLQRLRDAFAEGRLDDGEFDERMRAALVARTYDDLDALCTDLPTAGAATAQAGAVAVRRPGRFAIALKSSVRRAGRWRVPDRYTAVVYKGSGWLDLRAAELQGPVTTIFTVAYKSRVTILVPPGVHVEMSGFGVTQGELADEDSGYRIPPDAPVVHVRGLGYRGTVEVSARPPGGRRALSGNGDGQ